jgi:hypothetical protein
MVGSLWMGGTPGALCPAGALKLKPQTSQNCPDRAVPQLGHDCPAAAAWAGCAAVPGGGTAEAGLPIRIPHVSQKSVLADS